LRCVYDSLRLLRCGCTLRYVTFTFVVTVGAALLLICSLFVVAVVVHSVVVPHLLRYPGCIVTICFTILLRYLPVVDTLLCPFVVVVVVVHCCCYLFYIYYHLLLICAITFALFYTPVVHRFTVTALDAVCLRYAFRALYAVRFCRCCVVRVAVPRSYAVPICGYLDSHYVCWLPRYTVHFSCLATPTAHGSARVHSYVLRLRDVPVHVPFLISLPFHCRYVVLRFCRAITFAGATFIMPRTTLFVCLLFPYVTIAALLRCSYVALRSLRYPRYRCRYVCPLWCREFVLRCSVLRYVAVPRSPCLWLRLYVLAAYVALPFCPRWLPTHCYRLRLRLYATRYC